MMIGLIGFIGFIQLILLNSSVIIYHVSMPFYPLYICAHIGSFDNVIIYYVKDVSSTM
jgi:hypothetical protein